MRESMADVLRVELTFTDFDSTPSELTDLTGLTPSKTWIAGDSIERSKRRYPSNGWRLSSQKIVAAIEAGVDALFEQIAPNWEALRELSRECNVELSILVKCGEQVPPMHFRADQIERLAELSAEIDIDLYCLARP
jgi:hypothetical protein